MQQRLFPFQGWRLIFFQGVVFAVFLLFSIRMYDLQVMQTDTWQGYADDNRLNQLPIAAPRGVIYDRNGRILAGNVPAFNVTIIPAAVPRDREFEIYNRLSALVNVPPTAVLARERGGAVNSIEELVAVGEGIAPFREVIIAEDVDLNVALQILEERVSLPGVNITPIGVREYPTGALTAQVVGYMGPIGPEEAEQLRDLGYNPAYDRIGYSGVEFFLEQLLSGERGSELREVDVAGEVVNRVSYTDPIPGQSVQLTIDSELQQAAQTALENRISFVNTTENRIRTESGVVIAMNPQTGEILSLVSWPTYDNSKFARNIDYPYYLEVSSNTNKNTPLVNHAISSLYPPGSVWKVLSAIGILQEGVIAPQTTLFDGGNLVLPNRYAPNDVAAAQNFVCWKRDGHGALDMVGAIAQSCDVYFYQVGGGNPDVSPQVLRPNGLGPTDLFRYATAMGVGTELGIELPGEVAGRMPDPDWKRRIYGENWSTGDTYNAAFGQGYVTTTPLQLINAVAALANGGTLYQPTVVRNLLDAEGNVVQPFRPKVMRNLNIDNLPSDEPIKLTMVEDMIMKGPNSLACTCESDAPRDFYNPVRCNPETYVNTVNVGPDEFTPVLREYSVHVPYNYVFNGSICDENRFEPDYQPPFVSTANIQVIEQGMRSTVTVGTAQAANLPYVFVAGKTGTAEYCDDVARPLGLCVPGNWPSHAWFTSYAPYENPEIIIIGFVYNGGEGSLVALPVVVETLEAYYRLKNERQQGGPIVLPSTSIPPTAATPLPDADADINPDAGT